MPTSVTISIPVTARFDGCFCSDECEHMSWGETGGELCLCTKTGRKYLGAIRRETAMIQLNIAKEQLHSFVRTRWCCETFGMGEAVEKQAQPSRMCMTCGTEHREGPQYDGRCSKCRDSMPELFSTDELETMDAKDAEALRRWIQE